MVKKGDTYELHSRMDAIDNAFPDPGPEVWPMAAKFIKRVCPDDWDEILAMVMDPDQVTA